MTQISITCQDKRQAFCLIITSPKELEASKLGEHFAGVKIS